MSILAVAEDATVEPGVAGEALGLGLSPAAALFQSLSDPTRLAILAHLSVDDLRVVDLTARLGLAQSTVSRHLACLRDCGLVQSRAVGRASVFSLAVGDELIALLGAAERLVEATGDAVALCPLYGTARQPVKPA